MSKDYTEQASEPVHGKLQAEVTIGPEDDIYEKLELTPYAATKAPAEISESVIFPASIKSHLRTKGEVLLHNALMEIIGLIKGKPQAADAVLRQTLEDYGRFFGKIDAVRFNPPVVEDGTHVVRRTVRRTKELLEAEPSDLYRATDYMEVNRLLNTSGCWSTAPYWSWEVMAIVETYRGPTLVAPGDWIITLADNERIVLSDDIYRAMYA